MRALVSVLFVGLGLVPGSRAFDLRTDESGIYVVKWYVPTVSLQIKLSTVANLSEGYSQFSAVAEAAEMWNEHMATLQLVSTQAAVSSTIGRNNINEVVMATDLDGDEFPVGALAVTRTRGDVGNALAEADIVFNGTFSWEFYRGQPKAVPDIRRVAVHELGHLLGMMHPDDAGQDVYAIMNSRVGAVSSPLSDDREGIQVLYGVPGQPPPNNHFAAATDLTTLGTRDYSEISSNVGADREPNEPAHVGIASGHSVWWKWTAPGLAQLSIDTFGSNFDTVLAVYTGTGLSDLTKVAENDDAETREQNPTPQRRRTSIVNINAVAGTTYYIVVDGWGDEDRFPAGSTGSVQMTMKFDAANSSPTIHTQPSEMVTTAGWRVYFNVGVVVTENVTYRWQRLPVGTAEWEDIVDEGPYSGAHSQQLWVDTYYSMNGDQFRCVVSNTVGSTTTRVVPLGLSRGPLPFINAQPNDVARELGDRVTLTVESSMSVHPYNVVPMTYQWYRGTTPIAGATDPTYTFQSTQLSEAGTYRVEVSNGSGTVTSRATTVQLANVPLVRPIGERRRLATAEQALILAVDATGTGALSYQWFRNGRPVAGATAATYHATAPTVGSEATYWVRITDAVGTRSGDPFFISVAAPQTRVEPWGWEKFGHRFIPEALDHSIKLAVDHWSAVAIQADGTYVEWAGGGYHSLPYDLTSVVAMTKLQSRNTALLADGTVVDSKWPERMPPDLSRVVALARGIDFQLALRTDGKVVAWGEPDSNVVNTLPTDLADVVAIAAGQYHALAVKSDGTVVSWGNLQAGYVATTPASVRDVVAAAAGANYSLVLKSDGTLDYWGAYPVNPDLTSLTDVVAIAGGSEHSLALHRDGTVSGWGSANGTPPEGLSRVLAIAAGDDVSMAVVEVDPDPVDLSSRLLNLSVRSNAGSGDRTLVMGFAIEGNGTQRVLARGIGPALQTYDVSGWIADPQLKLFRGGAIEVGRNDDWSDTAELRSEFSRLGAFGLPAGSRDAVLFLPLESGSYSAHVTANDGTTGVALMEVYDATKGGPTRFTNVSARTEVGTGENVLIAGFVLAGESTKTLLIRAVGPSLANFGLSPDSLLADPQFELRRGEETVASNDNWEGGSALKTAFGKVGAFALDSDSSRDAAALVTLAPGVYTVKVSGVSAGTGIALVEIYELP